MSPVWPEPRKGIPEGKYTFTLTQEAEVIRTERGSQRLVLQLVAMPGDHRFKQSFVPWEEGYEELCMALGVEHGKNIRMEGASFDGEVVYEPSKTDPTKNYTRIRNIRPAGEFAPEDKEKDGDIPF